MRPIRALLIYFISVFFGGALLAPWLWHLAQFASASFPHVANAPFHRFLDRAFLIVALAGIWPLLRALGAISLRETGIVPPHGQMKMLLGGLLLGLLSLVAVAVIEMVAGVRAFSHPSGYQIVKAVFSALAAAIVVGTIEEILFRGVLFGGMRRVLSWPLALFFSSVIFAFVHFLSRADIIGPVRWDSGLIALPRLFDLHAFFPEFLGLTLVGLLLGLAYQRSGNLYFSIGMHAGWVFVLKIFSSLTVQSSTPSGSFWGSDKMVDGWLAFLALGFILAFFHLLPLEKREPYRTFK